ncbi:MAG: hypothetical protein IKT50_02035 [Clostridia bacterium]|nr:hypothetical protein [Clostridia bacterium]
MNLGKETKKNLEQSIKNQGKKLGFKSKNGFIFSKIGENFVTVTYVIVNFCKLVYTIELKKFSYDDIFWDILHMPDNKKMPFSLRANGAFSAPSIILSQGEIALSSDVEAIPESFLNMVEEKISFFLSKHEVNSYVLSHKDIPCSSTLMCLAFLDMDNPSAAVKIAQKEIAAGNRLGGFENEGKVFFEWILFKFFS